MNGPLPFGFDLDNEYFIGITQLLSIAYGLFSVFFFHPLVMYMLWKHSSYMGTDYRIGSIYLQVSQLLADFWICFCYQLYPLLPLPALICNGLLCRFGVSGRILLTVMAIFVINIIYPFLFLLFRMQQRIIARTESIFILSVRSQFVLSLGCYCILVVNVVVFYLWGGDSHLKAREIQKPYLNWTSRFPSIQFYGTQGNIGDFMKVMKLLGISLVGIFPVVPALCIHITAEIIKQSKRKNMTSSQAVVIRATVVLLARFASSALLFVTPLVLLFTGMLSLLDFIPSSIFPFVRGIAITAFYTHSFACTSVFLVMNTGYRKVLLSWLPFGIKGKKKLQVSEGGTTMVDVHKPTRENSAISARDLGGIHTR